MLIALVLVALPFPDALKQPTLARLERFTFPPASAFESQWARRDTNGVLVVKGTLTPKHLRPIRGFFTVRGEGSAWHVTPLASEARVEFDTKSIDGTAWALVLDAEWRDE
jgi:hypothetical protein